MYATDLAVVNSLKSYLSVRVLSPEFLEKLRHTADPKMINTTPNVSHFLLKYSLSPNVAISILKTIVMEELLLSKRILP